MGEAGAQWFVPAVDRNLFVIVDIQAALLLLLGIGPEHAHENDYDDHDEEEEKILMREQQLTPSAFQWLLNLLDLFVKLPAVGLLAKLHKTVVNIIQGSNFVVPLCKRPDELVMRRESHEVAILEWAIILFLQDEEFIQLTSQIELKIVSFGLLR